MKSITRKLAARLGKSEAGFTLIEMLVVVGIIIALAAVIVPLVVQFASKGDDGAYDSEQETVQTALYTMMADKKINTVTARDAGTDTAVKAWSALPLGSDGSTVRSINGYLGLTGSETTLYYYCWNSNGKVIKQITVTSGGNCS